MSRNKDSLLNNNPVTGDAHSTFIKFGKQFRHWKRGSFGKGSDQQGTFVRDSREAPNSGKTRRIQPSSTDVKDES